MIWLLHPTGNTFVRALLSAAMESGCPFRFFTTLGLAESSWWPRLLPPRLRAELRRRSYAIPNSRLAARPALELARLLALRLGWPALLRHETGPFCVDAVYRDLDACVARRLRAAVDSARPETVYAYEDAAFEVFKAAGERGARRVYELPIAYWETSRRLLEEEAARLPEWEPTLVATRDSPAKCARKTAELEMADAVVCPSDFVFRTLPETTRLGKRCLTVPFGSPENGSGLRTRTDHPGGRLRFLFAGSMSQRKGLGDLFEAVRLLGGRNFDLVVMGSPVAPLSFYRGKLDAFVYEPPRPHAEVMRLMAGCDVLVLPSIVEGRALVQQEALSQGLPLIVTPNAGGEDLVDEGETGFLVPIRNPAAIAEKMAWFLDHPGELARMREAARRKAASLSWRGYGARILAFIGSLP